MNAKRMAYRKGLYTCMGISFFGLLLVCSMFTGVGGALQLGVSFFPQIVCGYVAIAIVAELIGFRYSHLIVGYGSGALYGYLLFLVGVIAGSSVTMLLMGDFDVYSYITKPLYLLGISGFVPACIIGMAGARIINNT